MIARTFRRIHYRTIQIE